MYVGILLRFDNHNSTVISFTLKVILKSLTFGSREYGFVSDISKY